MIRDNRWVSFSAGTWSRLKGTRWLNSGGSKTRISHIFNYNWSPVFRWQFRIRMTKEQPSVTAQLKLSLRRRHSWALWSKFLYLPERARWAHLARALGISRINPVQENNCAKRTLLDNVGDEVEKSGRRLIQKEHVIDSGGSIVL